MLIEVAKKMYVRVQRWAAGVSHPGPVSHIHFSKAKKSCLTRSFIRAKLQKKLSYMKTFSKGNHLVPQGRGGCPDS